MADPRQDRRIAHGLIPVLVAMRVKAERDRRAAEAAKKAGTEPEIACRRAGGVRAAR